MSSFREKSYLNASLFCSCSPALFLLLLSHSRVKLELFLAPPRRGKRRGELLSTARRGARSRDVVRTARSTNSEGHGDDAGRGKPEERR